MSPTMDVGEIAVYLHSIGAINEQLVKIVKEQCQKHIESVLADIALNTGLSLADLRAKYLTDIEIGEVLLSSAAKSRRKIDRAIRCCARTSKGGR